MNQLPLEFKLFMNGVHVGYEEHFFNPGEGIKIIELFHQDLQGKTGRILYGFYIPHDEKRQWTGHKDKNGEKIYLDDKLKDLDGNIFTVIFDVKLKDLDGNIFTVIFDAKYGTLHGKHESWFIGNKHVQLFSRMELVK